MAYGVTGKQATGGFGSFLVASSPVLLPAALLEQLLNDVTGVGPGKSLENKVALAQTYYAVPDVQATCAVLTDFISQVKALAGKKKLATALSDQLIADAQVIMEAIGCN